MLESVRWILLAAVLGLALAYVVWGRPPAAPLSTPTVLRTPAATPARTASPAVPTLRTDAPKPPERPEPPRVDPALRSKLTAEPETLDLGTVNPDTHHDVTFLLRNPTQKRITILQVVPGCGCVTPKLEKPSLGPGEKSVLKVKYFAKRERTKDRVGIKIVTDEKNGGQLALLLKATVRHPIVLTPRFLNFGVLKPGGKKVLELTARHAKGQAFKIRSVASGSHKEFSFTWAPLREGDATAYRIRATCQAGASRGTLSETCVLVTDLRDARMVPFSVIANIRGNVYLSPRAIMVTRPSEGALKPLVVYLRRTTPGALKLRSVRERQGRKIAYTAQAQPGQIRLTLTFPEDFFAGRTQRGVLQINVEGEPAPLLLPYTILPPVRNGKAPAGKAPAAAPLPARRTPVPGP